MTQPKTAVLPDIAHQSTHWIGGTPQQTGAWCFAAAEQCVQMGFGAAADQAEIAHRSVMAIGASGVADPSAPNAAAYHQWVTGLVAGFGLASTDWAQVSVYVTGDPTYNGYLRGSYGVPGFTGRTVAAGGRLTTDQIMQTIDADGLVVKGSSIHYTVIYGYRRRSGAVEFHVYNPYNGGGDHWIAADQVTADMGMSFRVTA